MLKDLLCIFLHRDHWEFKEIFDKYGLYTPRCNKCKLWHPGFSYSNLNNEA